MPAKKAATKKAATKKKAPAKKVTVQKAPRKKTVEVQDETTGETTEVKVTTHLTLDQVVQEVLEGKWGEGQERRKLLSQAGYNHNEVQKALVKLRNQT